MHDALWECGVPAYLRIYYSHGGQRTHVWTADFFVPRGVSEGIVCTSSKAVHFLTLDHRSTSTQTSPNGSRAEPSR